MTFYGATIRQTIWFWNVFRKSDCLNGVSIGTGVCCWGLFRKSAWVHGGSIWEGKFVFEICSQNLSDEWLLQFWLCEVHLWSEHLAVMARQPFCGSDKIWMSQTPPPPLKDSKGYLGQIQCTQIAGWLDVTDPPTHWRAQKAIWAKYSVCAPKVSEMHYSIWSDAETIDKVGWTSDRSCLSTASSWIGLRRTEFCALDQERVSFKHVRMVFSQLLVTLPKWLYLQWKLVKGPEPLHILTCQHSQKHLVTFC